MYTCAHVLNAYSIMNIAAAVQDGEAHSSLCASEMLYLTLAYDWLIYGLVLYSQGFTAKFAIGGGFRNIYKYRGWAKIKVFPLHC